MRDGSRYVSSVGVRGIKGSLVDRTLNGFIGWRLESFCKNVFLLFLELLVCCDLGHPHPLDGTSTQGTLPDHVCSPDVNPPVGQATRHQSERRHHAYERFAGQRGEFKSKHQL